MTERLTDEQVASHLGAFGWQVDALATEVQASRKLIADMLALHRRLPGECGGLPWCEHDGEDWPCALVRLIEEAQQ